METEHLCRVAVGKMENVYKNESWQKKHYNNNTDKTLIVPYEISFFFFFIVVVEFCSSLAVDGGREKRVNWSDQAFFYVFFCSPFGLLNDAAFPCFFILLIPFFICFQKRTLEAKNAFAVVVVRQSSSHAILPYNAKKCNPNKVEILLFLTVAQKKRSGKLLC